jgi:hypothetical protein
MSSRLCGIFAVVDTALSSNYKDLFELTVFVVFQKREIGERNLKCGDF